MEDSARPLLKQTPRTLTPSSLAARQRWLLSENQEGRAGNKVGLVLLPVFGHYFHLMGQMDQCDIVHGLCHQMSLGLYVSCHQLNNCGQITAFFEASAIVKIKQDSECLIT